MGARRALKVHLLLVPFIGMGLFLILYVIAAFYYPGGSYADPDQIGFSFLDNYLCDLLDNYAINGNENNARIPSRIAFGFLCFTLIFIWYNIPRLFKTRNFNHHLIRVCGILSMLTAMFIASGTHDTIVYMAGIVGIVAFMATLMELFKEGRYKLLIMGLCCLVLILINYVIYEMGINRNMLPVIQKMTFIICISWFLLLMFSIHKKLTL